MRETWQNNNNHDSSFSLRLDSFKIKSDKETDHAASCDSSLHLWGQSWVCHPTARCRKRCACDGGMGPLRCLPVCTVHAGNVLALGYPAPPCLKAEGKSNVLALGYPAPPCLKAEGKSIPGHSLVAPALSSACWQASQRVKEGRQHHFLICFSASSSSLPPEELLPSASSPSPYRSGNTVCRFFFPFSFFFFFWSFLRATPMAYGGSQARG